MPPVGIAVAAPLLLPLHVSLSAVVVTDTAGEIVTVVVAVLVAPTASVTVTV